MSTNKTPNYQLSQWLATDPVRMSDFNADNAIIDAALKAEADARSVNDLYVKLVDATTELAQQQVSVSVADIDFTTYRQIDVYFQAKMSAYTSVSFYLNDALEKEYYPFSGSGGSSGYNDDTNSATMAGWRFDPGQTQMVHLDLGMPCAGNHIFCQFSYAALGKKYTDYSQKRMMSTSITWSNLTNLIFKSNSADDPIPAGARITVIGLKF